MMKIVAAAAFRISHEYVPVLLCDLNETILIARVNSVASLVCMTEGRMVATILYCC